MVERLPDTPSPRPDTLPPAPYPEFLAPLGAVRGDSFLVRPTRPEAVSPPWQPWLSPLELPSPTRLLTEGADILGRYHPRDPGLRMGVEPFEADDTLTTVEPAPPGTAVADDAAPQSDSGTQSNVARIAMYIGMGGGVVGNTIDVLRTMKKYPEALRAGRFDPALGPLGRLPTAVGLTALTRPDNRILDPQWRGLAASVATGGRSFDKFDEFAMRTSVLLGTSVAAIQIGASIPNLIDAVKKDGPWYENLVTSTSGRAGVLQLAGGTVGAVVFATALKQTAGTVAPGSGIIERVVAAGTAQIHARPVWGRVGLASGAIVGANMLGYLDFLNKGETRSVGAVLGDAAHRTPVLNDPEFRTAAILGAAGVTGFKVHRALTAGGGVAAIKTGHVVSSAVVVALLGAQLLGGLSGLDKPAGS